MGYMGNVGWNDQASAANDYNVCDLRLFQDSGYGVPLWSGSGWVNFSTGAPVYFGDSRNDRASSFQVT